MSAQYEFRIRGLREAPGQVKAATFQRVLEALLKTAERTARLLATGAGTEKGAKPRWLEETTSITLTGLKAGSTTLEIAAPQLCETARHVFAQLDFWTVNPRDEDTVLDLAARAVREIQTENPAGDYFDTSVLEAILQFDGAARRRGVSYELIPPDATHQGFTLDQDTCAQVKEWLARVPEPQSFVISGRLDEIKHGNGRFRLLVSERDVLLGRLESSSLNVEALRPLWGKRTTIEGIVYFKVNGQPRLVEARRISECREGDVVFAKLPGVASTATQDLFPGLRRQAGAFDPISLAGAWPGDESIEDLLKQLD